MKMSRAWIPLILVIGICGCATYVATYDVALLEVERPEEAAVRYGEAVLSRSAEDGVTKHFFEDDMIKSFWVVGSTRIIFSIENKTDYSIKLIWDETVYVDENGRSQRVMHQGVKYTDSHSSMPSSVIVKNGVLEDIILPSDNVYYESGKYGGWRTNPLFPDEVTYEFGSAPMDPDAAIADLEVLADSQKESIVRILLPLEIEGVVNEYLFSFLVEGYEIKPLETGW
jgi:hypothetical protein